MLLDRKGGRDARAMTDEGMEGVGVLEVVRGVEDHA